MTGSGQFCRKHEYCGKMSRCKRDDITSLRYKGTHQISISIKLRLKNVRSPFRKGDDIHNIYVHICFSIALKSLKSYIASY